MKTIFKYLTAFFLISTTQMHGQSNFYTGNLKYDNNNQTPLVGVPVSLRTFLGYRVASDTTDSSGFFRMSGFPNGSYIVEIDVNYEWGGVTSTDALLVMRYFNNFVSLNPLQIKSGDVNGSNSTNSADALLINRRITGQVGSFSVGNFTSTPSTLNFNGVPITTNIRALAVGDVNRSYTPISTHPTIVLDTVYGNTFMGTAAVTFTNSGSGVYERGICWGSSPNPTILSQKVVVGKGGFSFRTSFVSIDPDNIQYVRAYAITSSGVSYSNERSFISTSGPPCPGMGSVNDVEGNIYKTVQIGTQCWMQSNLKVSKYRNGDVIPTGLNNSDWQSTTSGAYSVYNNDPINENWYGKLYNHYSVTDVRGLCPTGWHVPTNTELSTLLEGFGSLAAEALISTGWLGNWTPFQNVAINSNISGFSALPGGNRGDDGVYYNLNRLGYWWTSTLDAGFSAKLFSLPDLQRGSYFRPLGISVRCIYDSLLSPTPPLVSSIEVDSITSTKALVSGFVWTTGGSLSITSRGFEYSGQNISRNITFIGNQLGHFSARLDTLTPLTTYSVRAFSTNSIGTGYGKRIYFTTLSPPTVPSVITSIISGISFQSAFAGGNVTADGGASVTARGVAYDTAQNPTTANNTTSDGTGFGAFNSSLTGLTALTLYYVRAFATNSLGTGYGSQVSFTTSAVPQCPGTPTVTDIDGNVYQGIQIGTQCWTQSNLKVSKYRNGDPIPTGLTNTNWQNTTSGAYAIYNNDPVNDGLYGKLYNHYAVTDSRGLCPTGWHVPSYAEWTTLVNQLGGSSVAGGALKSTAMQPTPGGWNSPNTGATNSSGFTALPGGRRFIPGDFLGMSNYGYWWSSSVLSGSDAWSSNLNSYSSNIALPNSSFYSFRSNGFSVRCLKDSSSGGSSASLPTVTSTSSTIITSTGATTGGDVTSDGGVAVTARGVAYGTVQNPTTSNSTTSDGTGTGAFNSSLTGLTASTLYYVRAFATNSVGTAYGNEVSFTTLAQPCPGTPTVTDVDNNTYNTVQIGTQCWTQSNLKVSKYRNGDIISTGLTDSAWQNTTSGAYAVFNNNPVNDGLYGKLYNHYAVTDGRGLCPTGWHVSTDAEWNIMVKYLDPNADTVCGNCWQSSIAGGALRSTATLPTPGGWYSPNTGATNSSGFTALPGGFRYDIGYFNGGNGFWWSSSVMAGSPAFMLDNSTRISRSDEGRTFGLSVRCLKDGVAVGGSASVSTVTTTSITSITSTVATSGGNVTSDGGAAVTARGVAFGTYQNPTTASSTTINGAGPGTFTSTLTGLTASTLYYVRAFATNAIGTGYGNEVSFTTLAPQPCPGTPSVSDVDGNVYHTVQIGNQCWTQSNLKVSKYRNGDNIPTGLSNSAWENTTTGAYAIYNNDPVNNGLYGKLYNNYAVTDNRGLCPTGWHVPSDGEWNIMVKYLDPNADTVCGNCYQSSIAGGALKSTATQPTPGGWNSPNTGATNSSGFTALPGGRRAYNGDFDLMSYIGYWWSSSVSSGSGAWGRELMFYTSDFSRVSNDRTVGFSVLCLKNALSQVNTTSATTITSTSATTGGNITDDGGVSVTVRGVAYGTAQNPTTANSTTNDGTGTGAFNSSLTGLTASTLYYVRAFATNSVGTGYGSQVSFTTSAAPQCPGTSTVTDFDGNVYNTVQIGTQCWTQSNLKVSKYRNGDIISTGLTDSAWQNTTSGAYAVFNNNPVNDGLYGKLYNHYAVTDSRGLCPTGWHVPSDGEWNILVKYLDPNADTVCAGCMQSSIAGGALKSTATLPTPGGWYLPNTGATNSSEFTALPGGYRRSSGGFSSMSNNGFWWSSSVLAGSDAYQRILYSSDCAFYSSIRRPLASGLSVRCLKD